MIRQNKKIAILLAAYNGEVYLHDQLDSLFRQTHQNFIVVVRDDGSTDNSVDIIEQYKKKYPEKVRLIYGHTDKTLGPSGNFSFLLSYGVDSQTELSIDYFAFCDQDDIWRDDKMERQLEVMLTAEEEHVDLKNVPILVHTDLEVIDAHGGLIADSFFDYQGLQRQKNKFSNLLIVNIVTGCTVLLNPALARLSMPISKNAIMHDWWFALVASAFGQIFLVDSSLVKYRQHPVNTIGAKPKRIEKNSTFSATLPRIPQRIYTFLKYSEFNGHLSFVAIQARAFNDQYHMNLKLRFRLILWLTSCMETSNRYAQRIVYRFVRSFKIS